MGNAIRRVRTPAGVRRFGRPIGAPILAGEGPDLPGVAPASPLATLGVSRAPAWARKPHWIRGNDRSWVIHPGEERLAPGDLVEVHRRDGSSSWHVVGERVEGTGLYTAARKATPEEVEAWKRRKERPGYPIEAVPTGRVTPAEALAQAGPEPPREGTGRPPSPEGGVPNRYGGRCERCRRFVAPGQGIAYQCQPDTDNCDLHVASPDGSGWHVRCRDPDECIDHSISVLERHRRAVADEHERVRRELAPVMEAVSGGDHIAVHAAEVPGLRQGRTLVSVTRRRGREEWPGPSAHEVLDVEGRRVGWLLDEHSPGDYRAWWLLPKSWSTDPAVASMGLSRATRELVEGVFAFAREEARIRAIDDRIARLREMRSAGTHRA
jgi:hypothetical protein